MTTDKVEDVSVRVEGKPLVQSIADKLRELILAADPDARIGSLRSIAESLGVGIVTVQQAARILEHEGLLEVRRGPGGGYYGRRPDAAALGRALSAYMQSDPSSWEEALDMTSLLFNELAAAAARCEREDLHQELESLQAQVANCEDDAAVTAFEAQLQDLLFRMVERPLFELLTRVTLGIAASWPTGSPFSGMLGTQSWKTGRQRIIAAILAGDEELARFEADRSNRRFLMNALRGEAGARHQSG